MGFKAGQKVSDNACGVYTVEAVEKDDDPNLGSSVDMGRYTLKRADGTLHYNFPGYLLRPSK